LLTKAILSRLILVPEVIWKGLTKIGKLLKADLHIHSSYSADCKIPLDKIITRCLETGINCIAIADHGTTEGALKMQSIAPFPVIVAEEILTTHGEIMGMFLKETIPSGQSVEQTISQIRAQDGLVNIPHPFYSCRPSALDRKIIEKIVRQIDIIEVYNSRNLLPQSSIQAKIFAQKHGLGQGAGSDAHTLSEIGNAYVEMPQFVSKGEFLQALAKGKIFGQRSNPFFRLGGAWARLRNQFK
jgi:predicted metal-dependent phosphoesterase TrpH